MTSRPPGRSAPSIAGRSPRRRWTHGGYGAAALARPDARSAVETMLRLAAAEYTGPAHPPGCRGPGSQDVAGELRDIRRATTDALARKIRADVDRGLLPAGTDAASPAAFYAAVVQGLSTQARDGAPREQRERPADLALLAWPGWAAS
ncbi:hypothetical protein [Streptacidiphilus monticola]|uniref:TetR family transcriptional regulator n=1 Tax=Streptacidiphilus monticola TaxID=2161674 RepID=A0ABW1FY28_9ACTN